MFAKRSISNISVFLYILALTVGSGSAACGGSDRPEPRGSICTPQQDERDDCRIASEYPDVSDSDLKSVRDEESLRRICEAKCSKIEWLSIEDIGGLENLRALEGVEVEDRLSVSSLPNLRTLEGVTFEEIQDFTVSSNPRLESLQGLESLRTVESKLRVANNPRLNSLEGFGTLEKVGFKFIIRGDNGFRNFEGLEQLSIGSSESTVAHLKIAKTTELESLKGLAAVETLSHLHIWGNQKLRSLKGLEKLKEVSDLFSIENNPNLPSCLAEGLLERVDFQDDYPDIRENGGYDYEVCEESGSG